MDPVFLLILILICRVVIVHSLYNIYLVLHKDTYSKSRFSFLIGSIIYLVYLSSNTMSNIPHTFDDALRVLSGAICWYVVSKYMRRKQ